ncbi:MAG: FAD-binding oxidoreductase [Alphaproteobacteria bacterium]|nr:FAD-binding oxidoreductase [Alphaproteobacteria bacterium]MBU1280834.1 FAD-binding oxidoreductase [Alphaproteobacteria bacterium]MBU1575258.1 FAD-binding oxidoreductase [Alphaproteobacteria bacterium]MBU1829139.1 FAD-binding oxidoreductase [Alphaproteobacteria bacterium]MBU2076684.1 FAD-binding oxidoreductase [Alphaproteobacteria bacterium]
MAPVIAPVQTSLDTPEATCVVVIGGGIVGLTAALNLAERGIPVVVLEKGRLAAEQSSRNLGWVRKTGRDISDLPLSVESDRLWAAMAERVGADVGYRQAGIMYVARTEAEMEKHQSWLGSAGGRSLDSRLLSPAQINTLVPGGVENWYGGIHTPSDGRAEPTLASSAIAAAAIVKGAVIVENCAVRRLVTQAGRISGVMTERGEIRCDQVLLAGGIWSRRFLANHGVALPILPLVASVFRTGAMEGPTDIAVGAADFSFRKRHDGGYTITQRGALFAPLMLDHLMIGHRYLPVLKAEWKNVRVSLGGDFLRDLALARRWSGDARSPMEQLRTMDPAVHHGLNADAMRNLCKAWPVFNAAVVKQSWAGMIDVTPDSMPVISPVEKLSGLTLATGFSGHGFGTAPAAGQLAADLITGDTPVVDPTPYRFDRL